MIRRWAGLGTGRRIVLTVIGAILALNVAITALGWILDPDPGGPASSPRTTDGSGLAAYAHLLRERGLAVEVLTGDLGDGDLSPEATVFLVDPVRPGPDDGRLLSGFVEDGGVLVLAGPTTADLLPARTGADTVTEPAPARAPLGVIGSDPLTGSARNLAGVSLRWRDIGGFEPLAGSEEHPLLIVGDVGAGRIVALADAGPLRNENLARADNAALGVALAGHRPIVFVDRTTDTDVVGLAAVPTPWKWTAAALALSGTFLLWSVGTRFGPPEPAERVLRPARLVHVEAVAAGITRQRPDPETTVERIRDRERTALADELRLDPTVSDTVLAAEAERHGIDPGRITPILQPATTTAEALALGRVAARRADPRRSPDHPTPGAHR